MLTARTKWTWPLYSMVVLMFVGLNGRLHLALSQGREACIRRDHTDFAIGLEYRREELPDRGVVL